MFGASGPYGIRLPDRLGLPLRAKSRFRGRARVRRDLLHGRCPAGHTLSENRRGAQRRSVSERMFNNDANIPRKPSTAAVALTALATAVFAAIQTGNGTASGSVEHGALA